MATLQQQVFQQVINDPRSRKTNVPQSDRTFFEMLNDPSVGDIIKQDVVDSFNRTYVKAPLPRGKKSAHFPRTTPLFAAGSPGRRVTGGGNCQHRRFYKLQSSFRRNEKPTTDN